MGPSLPEMPRSPVCDTQQLVWSFLAHTGLTLDHQPPPNL
jgi:hypothetical protein